MIAKVEPLTSARALRGPFDYRVPAEMGGIDVGSVLLVPFGRRRVTGVVVELAERSSLAPERLCEPIALLEAGVPAELVRLGLWTAREYCSTPARGLALVTPPGTGTGRHRRLGSRRALVATITSSGRSALAAEGRLGARQRGALEALAVESASVAAVSRAAACDHSTIRSLEARGLVTIERSKLSRDSPRSIGVQEPAAAPTAAQAAAIEAIEACMDWPGGAGPNGGASRSGDDAAARDAAADDGASYDAASPDRRFLLHGVTGSGKTEVYLRAASAALRRGRSAIILVPEIALTPQIASRFERRFGGAVAVLHSRLGAAERYQQWLRVRRGEARVCVGPRSAIFAPACDVGLIVVDEEHDSSYKHEGDPRYDARRVAERRAQDAGAVLVAGSATPRPESYQRLRHLTLPERVDCRPLPPVELVAMAGTPGSLHARSRAALEEIRREGGKAIILLNRRGWSSFLSCHGCGRGWGCPRCDISLVVHRSAGRLACHHCGHSESSPAECPDCGSASLAHRGAGTEQLEHELSELMAPLPVFRLDSDSSRGRTTIAELLDKFAGAPAGVLLGTQMVAKGHDFPDVTLALVLDADATLRFPDFRAEERAFALVTQLAGRSGRGPRGGRVIVQALDPQATPLRFAARHDVTGFLSGELARREALGYPPHSYLIRIVCSSAKDGPQLEAATLVRERIALPADRSTTVLGPAPLFRRAGLERSQILVKSDERAAAISAVRAAVEAVAARSRRGGVTFAVDVDPQ